MTCRGCVEARGTLGTPNGALRGRQQAWVALSERAFD